MTTETDIHGEEHSELVSMYVMDAVPASEVPAVEAQIAACAQCRAEIDALRPVVETFVAWPTDVLRPAASLWDRVAEGIGGDRRAATRPAAGWVEPDWREVAPGISVKMLAADPDRDLVTMLVRLNPGVNYPPHIHGGIEELFLLDGELWINDRKLHPGDYNRAEPGTADHRVWSETGCTCVLITSPSDELR